MNTRPGREKRNSQDSAVPMWLAEKSADEGRRFSAIPQRALQCPGYEVPAARGIGMFNRLLN